MVVHRVRLVTATKNEPKRKKEERNYPNIGAGKREMRAIRVRDEKGKKEEREKQKIRLVYFLILKYVFILE